MDAPSQPAAAHPSRIAVVSFFILALELALIRQIPAEVKAISYFTNLILIASFFGLGVGCILQKRRDISWLLPIGMLLIFGFVYVGRGIVIYQAAADVHYWAQDANLAETALRLPLFPAALIAFVLVALPFAAMGQLLARRMDGIPRLIAYGWDIGGSILGTVAFAVGSYLHLPPWIWPPLLVVVWSVLFLQGWASRVVHLIAGALFVMFAISPHASNWSPYYLIQHQQEELGLRVWVNSGFHQWAVDFAKLDDPEKGLAAERLQTKFGIPYEIYREYHGGASPERVLILGAGTGNDVNVALMNGAQRVVAVEIDPVILSLGQRFNTTQPYDDPRVEVHVDDARHYLRNAEERFDLIVFATLDSQTLLSGVANLRLENYVYTVESLEEARNLLADDGMVSLFYSVMKPWLYERIVSTVHEAFGDRFRYIRTSNAFLFNTAIIAAPGIDGFPTIEPDVERMTKALINTDDWPYLYLERPTISPVYIKLFVAIGLLILMALLLLRRIHPVTGLHANFLFLGMGFMLLESAAIVRLALVFGSTWVVNAVVFAAALLTILLGNTLVFKKRAPALKYAWIGLFATLLVNYFFPMQWLSDFDFAPRVLLAIVLIGAPIFFAAICFSSLFEREKVTGYPLGINLIGAMSGGVLEYLSMLIGMRDVWLVLLLVYWLAWVATRFGSGGGGR